MRIRRRLGPNAAGAELSGAAAGMRPEAPAKSLPRRDRPLAEGFTTPAPAAAPLLRHSITISLELGSRRGLLRADAPGGDVRLVIVFAANRRVRETAQHRDLSDVRQRVGNRTLKQPLCADCKRRVGPQVVVEFLQRV